MTRADAPKVNSARTPPPSLRQIMAKANNDTARRIANTQKQDPRFNPLVHHGNAVKQNVERQYSFLGDMADTEQRQRTSRMRALRREVKLRDRERTEAEIATQKKKKGSGGKSGDESDASDESDDDDDDDDRGVDEETRIRIGLMRDSELTAELDALRKASNRHKMRTGEKKANEKRAAVRRTWAQSQVQAVKAGKQSRPFFLNQKAMKLESAKDQLKAATKQGVAAANGFMEKQLKKRFGAKHLTR